MPASVLRNFRKRAPTPTYSVPEGTRVYAIGDVHGCLDELKRMLDLIDKDLAARPVTDPTLIFLGDLIDRGPDSAGVIDHLLYAQLPASEVFLLKGNHEEAMLGCLEGGPATYGAWLQHGGLQTLESYGITRRDVFDKSFDLPRAMRVVIPPMHIQFLRSFQDHVQIGDYVFVHAGIRPGVPLEQQTGSDLRWIRSGFLGDKTDHGFIVVHGHTVVPKLQRHRNRIAVDTGCYLSGKLSAAVLEGDSIKIMMTRPDSPVSDSPSES